MMKNSILYLTDFYYQARGRKYYEEDLFITEYLKDHFNLLIANPQQAMNFLQAAEAIVIRNTGPVIYYLDYFNAFKKEAMQRNILTFNSLDGKADMQGKYYLVELTRAGYPVIPTINSSMDLPLLGDAEKFVSKPMQGADSIDMEIIDRQQLNALDWQKKILQPLVTFQYEVSFYFINDEFQYALYAPHKNKRWQLEHYAANEEDLSFACKFIAWNSMRHGLQRVDACRLSDGRLLLVELEDLNPYLSLHLLSPTQQKSFLQNFNAALQGMLS